MNDPLTSALAHERLKPDKMEHSARQTAHLGEKARKDEEDAKQLKEDERERAKGHENIMGAPFANSVNNDECCPVVGGLYFPHIHVANPNVPQKEKIAFGVRRFPVSSTVFARRCPLPTMRRPRVASCTTRSCWIRCV